MKIIEYDPAKIKFLPNMKRSEPFIMDSTAYKGWVECRRKYFYRFVLGKVPIGNKYQVILDFGSAYHKFRELLETSGYAVAMKYALSVVLPEQDPKSKFAFYNGQRLIKTCQKAFEHVQEEKKEGKFEVLAVEQPFNVEVAPGLFTGGRADQIVRWMGKIWGRDFKTTTKDKATFQKQLDPNDQAMRYIVGESKVTGQEVAGIIFEAVYNSKTEGPTIYSVLSTRNQWQKEIWLAEQEVVARDLKNARELDIWPMDTAGKCDWCPYHPVCRASSAGSMEGILKQNYKYEPWDHTKIDQNDE